MNLRFEPVEEKKFQGTPEAIAAFSGYPARLRARLEEILEDAVDEGHRVAIANAPRDSKNPMRNAGHRIVDSIERTNTVSHRGGAGGGATMSKSLIANGFIASHLRYVFEGTGKGRHVGASITAREFYRSGHLDIRPKLKMRNVKAYIDENDRYVRSHVAFSRVFAIQKEGEGVHFRAGVSGQVPNQIWWERAQDAMNRRMEEGAARLYQDVANQRPTNF